MARHPIRRLVLVGLSGLSLYVASRGAAPLRLGLSAASNDQSPPSAAGSRAQDSDLDTFMREVMERRDDNWKKLQQYILDEREEIDVRGPGRIPIWGARHDFTWFIQDGYFVRSPLKANGVTIGEDDRRKYEANYLRRQEQREKNRRARQQQSETASADSVPTIDSQPVPTDIE